MAVNHIVYNSRSLIDLRADTITAEDLFTGATAHKADGTVITGTLLEGFPEQYSFYDAVQDSNGECILDMYETAVKGRIIYQRT